MNDFTHHTAKEAVVLLGGKASQELFYVEAPKKSFKLKTEVIEGSVRIGKIMSDLWRVGASRTQGCQTNLPTALVCQTRKRDDNTR